jgi:hypothetical protein
MSRIQTGPRIACEEIPGKSQNCNAFGEYELPGNSPEAAMCNGGAYKGDWYNECPVKFECKTRTLRKHSLPILNEPKPFGARSQIVAQTPNVNDMLRPVWEGLPASLTMPTNIPTKTASPSGGTVRGPVEPHQIPYPHAYPVKPPETYPVAMQTAYAGPQPVMTGGVTPTFLPANNEGIFGRLAKNVAQGMVGSTGWHIFDYARTIDMFGRKPQE